MGEIYTRQAVLTVGNALNGSSFRGGALGFKLEALLKVTHPFHCPSASLMLLIIVTRDQVREGRR